MLFADLRNVKIQESFLVDVEEFPGLGDVDYATDALIKYHDSFEFIYEPSPEYFEHFDDLLGLDFFMADEDKSADSLIIFHQHLLDHLTRFFLYLHHISLHHALS